MGSKVGCHVWEFLRRSATDNKGRITPLALLRCLLDSSQAVTLQNEVKPLQGETNGKDGKCL